MENYAPVFRIISIVCFSVAGASLLLALFLFFKFRIISVIGDLTGKTAKKSIEKMREENAKSGVKSHRPTPAGKSRGPITKPMDDYKLSNKPEILGSRPSGGSPPYPDKTAPMSPAQDIPTAPIGSERYAAHYDTQVTAPINTPPPPAPQYTAPYAGGRGGYPGVAPGSETSVLGSGTQVLDKDEINKKLSEKKVEMHLVQNIILVHTNEYI